MEKGENPIRADCIYFHYLAPSKSGFYFSKKNLSYDFAASIKDAPNDPCPYLRSFKSRTTLRGSMACICGWIRHYQQPFPSRLKLSMGHCKGLSRSRPARIAELPRSNFDPELFPYSAYVEIFVTFATKVPYLTFCNKM